MRCCPRMRVPIVSALIVVLGVVGCSKAKVSSVSESSEVNHLSLDDAVQYCKDVREYRRASIPESDWRAVSCGVRALFGGASLKSKREDDLSPRDACHKNLDACIEKKEKTDDSFFEMDCSRDKVRDSLHDCPELTVGEMNDCLREMPEQVAAMAKIDPCDYLDEKGRDMDEFERYANKMMGPKCKALEKKCGFRRVRKYDPENPGGDGTALESLQAQAQAASKLQAFEDLQIKLCACKDRACFDEAKQALSTVRSDYATKYNAEQAKKRAEIEAAAALCEVRFERDFGR
jgi:hypothetical protein